MKPSCRAALALVFVLLLAIVWGCSEEREWVRLYHTAPVAPSLTAEAIGASWRSDDDGIVDGSFVRRDARKTPVT